MLFRSKKSYETQGREMVLSFEKGVTLALIDDAWKEHLREMDDLKQAVQNATLEQKDPLLVYKLESFNLFRDMITRVSRETLSFLVKGNLPADSGTQVQQARFQQQQVQRPKEKLVESRSEQEGREGKGKEAEASRPKQQPVKAEVKIGRNDPCPCGSGKKYKQCHGQGQ